MPAELESIIDPIQGRCVGSSGACIDPIFGPTIANGHYWSASSGASGSAWVVSFFGDDVRDFSKALNLSVRAVRPGS